jgi:hemerythrin-like domain-containing protein
MDSINLMMDEHKYIKRGLAVMRKMSIAILNGAEVPFDDFKKIIDFVRNYADKHHHNKEEEILFKKMVDDLGQEMVQAPISGMLVEHDFGRLFIKNLELALERVKEGDSDSKVDVIANAVGYTDLLNRHIDKEDKVIYTFARRSLNEEALKYINERCEVVECAAKEKKLQKNYEDTIEELENRWV